MKFLTALRHDERARGRLRSEVRLARQVSHAKVCRVYDIGEAQGESYLSMEYVDGEDLGALLRRIGKLPVDKAVEIALRLSFFGHGEMLKLALVNRACCLPALECAED